MGDLSRREIERDKAVIGLFSHHGDGQQGWKRGPEGAVGKAVRLRGRPGLPRRPADQTVRSPRFPTFIVLVQEAGDQAFELGRLTQLAHGNGLIKQLMLHIGR